MPEIKLGEVIIGICIILAVVASIFGTGYIVGSNHIQAKWDKEKIFQSKAVDEDRQSKQDQADSIDEQAAQEIQNLMIKNSKLQEELDNETNKASYDCAIPADGVRIHNNTIRANKS